MLPEVRDHNPRKRAAQTHSLDRAATGTGQIFLKYHKSFWYKESSGT
jgi:hypothetical protein